MKSVINHNTIGNKAAWAILLMWLFPCFLFAAPARAKVKKVNGVEYKFEAGFDLSVNQAKQKAEELAHIQAIADEFGTSVSKSTSSHASSTQAGDNVSSSMTFNSISLTDVRGEWIQDLAEPEYEIYYDDMAGLVVKVKVSGEIRERITADIDLKALVLRNGTTAQYQSEAFINGDKFYVLFQAPTNGYLVIYLTDVDGIASCLLPYGNQQESAMPIKKNQEYIFFSSEHAPENMHVNVVDEYTLGCKNKAELNRIHIIFSPNEFVKANDNSGNGKVPRNTSLKEFENWLGKARSRDAQMTYTYIDVEVKPKN